MTRRAFVHRISARAPDDVSGLESAFATGTIEARRVVAIFGKTEGNGCVNDFSRGLAARALLIPSSAPAPSPKASSDHVRRDGGGSFAALRGIRSAPRRRIARGGRARGGKRAYKKIALRASGTARPGRSRRRGRQRCDPQRRPRLISRRPFRADQVPPAHRGSGRRGGSAGREDDHPRHPKIHGFFARRVGAGDRGRAWRDRPRFVERRRHRQGVAVLFRARLDLGGRRALRSRDRRARPRRAGPDRCASTML